VANGIPISAATGNEYTPTAVSDGAGGAIVVWQDGRNGAGNYNIVAQRVDRDGNLLWAPGGVPICAAANNQINQVIVPDGAGGAYIAWQDYRNGTQYDIYAQHINGNGVMVGGGRWVADGLAICTAPQSQFYPQLSQDGAGGVFVGWQDFRTGTDNHIYAQHLTSTGALVAGWPNDGSPVCQAQYSQYYPVLTSDGGSNVFIAWQDYRDGSTNHIYAQKLTSDNRGWVADGVQVTNAGNGQFSPQISPDRQGGAFVTWYDSRNGNTNDIFVQQLNAAGVKNTNWDTNGLGICLAPNTQQFPVIATIGTGTSVMTWQDLRAGDVTTAAIFAQSAGTLVPTGVGDKEAPITTIQLSPAIPNPFRGSAQMRLALPGAASVQAEILDISGRRITTLASGKLAAGVHTLLWNGTNAKGESVAAGVYLVRVQTPGFNQVQRIVRLR
jgi:flagellar hook assembly protein FlgD